VPGEVYFTGYFGLAMAIVLTASAVLVTYGWSWARYPAGVVEALNLIGALITIVGGVATRVSSLAVLINTVVSVVVLFGLFTTESVLWFRAKANRAEPRDDGTQEGYVRPPWGIS
jgi:Co/Zn/Cd efflux system component